MSDINPAEVFPPGEFLRDELDARGWSQIEFAEIIGRPPRLINEIIAGKRGVTPETAKELAAALGTSPQFWMNLETAYRLWKAAPVSDRIAGEARLRERFPVREMIKRGWIEGSENLQVLQAQVLRFFHISSVDAPFRLGYAPKRTQSVETPATQVAWFYRVRQLAEPLHVASFTKEKLANALINLRQLIYEPEETRHIPRILAECGVRFVVVEPMPGSKIDGACFWLNDGASPVVGMSLRYDRIDNFWFVLRHELEHVLRGDGKDEGIIDIDVGEDADVSEEDVTAENAANRAASEFLIPHDKLDSFIDRVRPLYSEQKIINFSKLNGVHPGIVVGQLHRRQEIPYANLRRHLVKIRHILGASALVDGWGFQPQFFDNQSL